MRNSPETFVFQRHQHTEFIYMHCETERGKEKDERKMLHARKREIKISKNFLYDSRKFFRNSMNLKLHTIYVY